MKKINQLILFFISFSFNFFSQSTFPSNGAPNTMHSIYAFVNATIYVDFETVIKNGTLLIQDDKILSVGEKLEVPKNAITYDLKGKFIYPSFIDLYSDYGIPQTKITTTPNSKSIQMESNIKGAYGWNQAIKSDYDAYKFFVLNQEKAEELKKIGFGSVLSSSKDGIVRGSGVLVSLATKKENESIILDKAAGFYSFSKGSSNQDYPSSLMGSIALLRQTYYDAIWYDQNKNKTEYNISLDAFNKQKDLPSIFEVNDKLNAIRAAKIGKEFKINYIIKACGNEYQRINDIQNTQLKYIVPLNFPVAYDVEDPFDAESISLTELKHWELAPTNPATFEKNFIPFCLTASDLKDKNQFLINLRKAVKYGLSEKMALKALTLNPATFINVQDKIGKLKSGFLANFFISSTSIFESDAAIMQNWVNGQGTIFSDINGLDIRGNYTLHITDKIFKVGVSIESKISHSKISLDTVNKKMNYPFLNKTITFSFLYDSTKVFRGEGNYNPITEQFEGKGQLSSSDWLDFKLGYNSALDSLVKPIIPKKSDLNLGKVIYPFTAYGEPLPEEQGVFKDQWNKFKNRYSAILIKNATIWTNDSDSLLKEYDVYVVDGKIVRIAKNIDVPTLAFAKVIDAKGKHLTPGIIDEHSHIALSGGVNEQAQASTAEVRMGDVINPEDVNIYRQLAGGVTCVQLLHGSANPIGGQSALIKLRWGHSAEDLKYEKADGFIKFALGENVKQSNWGDQFTLRFPQSRMGVEQVYKDYFTRAKEYDLQWQLYTKLSPKEIEKNKITSPRKDLELDAISEILIKKRFITCHSYLQSEVNMLMHVADSFGFKVNTFTHILEGYKVADKMKLHGANASTFADWWAYKNEVMDAIPQNAALLTKMGITTAINSDDAEMARRLNQEAAKSIKYGGLSEIEALKLVTLNPAKMLHIDDKVGSIKVGKVADLVLWTDNPLSVYAKVDKTIIDGQIYFDKEEDAKLQTYIKTERARIISKLLLEKQKGTTVEKFNSKQQRLYHCNTIEGIDEEVTGER